jgi:drug/metabolite transporter (DMT)-like permease
MELIVLRNLIALWHTQVMLRFNRLPRNLRGGLWILGGGVFFTVMVTLIKIVGEDVSIFQILLVRQVTMTIVVMPVIARSFPAALRTNIIGLHVLRVTFALVAMIAGFTAVIHLPLAEATTLSFAKSIFVTLFAVWLLHEQAGARKWIAVLLGFGGVIVILRPDVTGLNIYALLGILSAAAAGYVMILIRRISQIDRPVTILAYQAFMVGGLMLVPAIYFWVPPTPLQWVFMMAIGLLAVTSQSANIQAYKVGDASAIAPVDYVRLLFAGLIGWLIFHESPEMETLIGATLIIVASIVTLGAKTQKAKAN